MKSIHLGVSGILVDDLNRVLLGRREATDSSFPGLWCSPGGGVEFGETLEEALQREYREEVHMDVLVDPNRIFIHERIRPEADKHTVLMFFLVDSCNAMDPAVGEGFDKVEWLDRQQVQAMMKAGEITPATSAAIREFLLWE